MSTAAATSARELADAVEADFQPTCVRLLTGEDCDDWLEARRRLDAGARRPDGDALLLHAALVGLARGASHDAFAHAAARKVNDKPLIEYELMAARLSTIATEEVICDLQLDRLCGSPAMGEAERELARREIRRAALAAVVEGAHVHGGHGFVQLGDPGRRVEIAHAVLARLGPESS